jgi:nuclear cap-binding protein subunit 1
MTVSFPAVLFRKYDPLTRCATGTPFAAEGRELAALLKRKAPEEEIQPVIDRIHGLAVDISLDPLVASTDVFVTAVLWVGSKSLSHVLAAIERTKDRLLDAGSASEAARTQIISAVIDYWAAHPGVAVAIVEKLLNYSILSPESVIQWALVSRAGASRGDALSWAWTYEMVANTVTKVTRRVRQVATVAEAGAEVDETREREIAAMRNLFRSMDDALVAWASGSKDEMIEATDGDGEHERLVRRWGERWSRVFRRKAAIEEAFLIEAAKARELAIAKREEELKQTAQNGSANGHNGTRAATSGVDGDIRMGNGETAGGDGANGIN